MKTDRELLELAARAAGLVIEKWIHAMGAEYAVTNKHSEINAWNPLTDDGDALRLAVKLRLNVHVWEDGRDVSVAKTLPDGDNPPDDDASAWFSERDQCGDIYIATRRAIVRAAAAIGESMK